MNLFETEAVVLRRKKINAYDCYLTLFSRSLGRIEVYAASANHPKNALNKGAQPFVRANFGLSGSRQFRLRSVDVIQNFYDLRLDLHAMLRASWMSDLLMRILEERQSQKKLYESLVNSLSLLERFPERRDEILLHFYGVLIHSLGIRPDVEYCVECGEKGVAFDIEAGGLLCEEHAGPKAIRHLSLGLLQAVFKEGLVNFVNRAKEQDDVTQLNSLLESYLSHHLDLPLEQMKQEPYYHLKGAEHE